MKGGDLIKIQSMTKTAFGICLIFFLFTMGFQLSGSLMIFSSIALILSFSAFSLHQLLAYTDGTKQKALMSVDRENGSYSGTIL